MQVTRELQVQGLSHSESLVRNCMLSLLVEQRYPGTDATRAAFAAMERWGPTEAFEYPSQICGLALDAECFDQVLEQLEAASGAGALEAKVRFGRWLADASPTLLESRWERFSRLMSVEGTSDFEKSLKRALDDARQRIDLHALPQDALWDRLNQAIEECAAQDDFPHRVVATIKACCEALTAEGRKDATLHATVHNWLAFDFDKPFEIGHWRAGAAIRLAGLAGMVEAVPRLLEMFDHDWDWWNEEIQKALRRMGSLEALRTVATAYPKLQAYAPLYLSYTFEDMWVEGMDELIYPLLELEEDVENLWRLGMALARYGSVRSMEAAAEIAGRYDHPETVDIAETLYSHHLLLGTNHPRLDAWKKRIDDYETRRREHRERMTAFLRGAPQPQNSQAPATLQQLDLPARRPPKVGRNDPCPCGSGKKYKKCCSG